MPLAAARISRSLVLPMAMLAGVLATSADANARTYRIRAYPGLELPAASSGTSVIVAQSTESQVASEPTKAATTEAPPGRVEKPEAASTRTEAGDPPTERAAAAALRAKQALSGEDGDQFEGGSPVLTELIPSEQSAPANNATATGQPVADEQRRRSSAALQAPKQKSSDQASATCIAGCR